MEQNKNISDKKIKRLISLYEKTLEIPENKPKKQFILCPIGIVGAGKTTVVKPLSKKLSLLRVSSDEIRELLKKNGFTCAHTKEIAYTIIAKYIKKGFSIAIDGDCVSEENQRRIKELEKQNKIKLFWIYINPPEKFIIDKLTNFKHTWLFKDADDAIENYLARKPLHRNPNFPFVYIFDTSKENLDEQINGASEIIEKNLMK